MLVGESEVSFTVHEKVITECSDFFRATCADGFREGKEKVVRLPEMEEEIFKSYVHWAYCNEVVTTEDDDPLLPEQSQGSTNLAKLYVTGDVLGGHTTSQRRHRPFPRKGHGIKSPYGI